MIIDDSIFSKSLLEKLKRIRTTGVTVLEAPAGYGKVSFINYVLKDAETYWNEQADVLPAAGERYVIYNESRDQRLFQDTVLRAVMPGADKTIHWIIITRSIEKIRFLFYVVEEINYIGAEDLTFDAGGLRAFFALNGKRLTEEQSVKVLERTGGWPLAVSTYFDSGNENGIFKENDIKNKIETRISTAFFDGLSQNKKEICMILGLFPKGTNGQLAFLAGRAYVDADLMELVDIAPLIAYNREEGVYKICPVMSEYLQTRLLNASLSTRREIYSRAGDWRAENGETREAIECYLEAKNYEKIVSLDLTNLSRLMVGGRMFSEVALEIAKNITSDSRKRYPLGMLQIAYILFREGEFQAYAGLMKILKDDAEKSGDTSLLGEWRLINAYAKFPNARAMTEEIQEAGKLLEGPSRVMSRKEACLFGCPSPWYLYYSKPGIADELKKDIDALSAACARVSNGRTAGMGDLFRAEIACMRGEFQEAEKFAYKASFIAESEGQITIAYGAAMILGRVAISRSDFEKAREIIGGIEKLWRAYRAMADESMLEFIESSVMRMLFSMMVDMNYISKEEQAPFHPRPFGALMLAHKNVTLMILQGQYSQAIGLMEAMEKYDVRICSYAARHYIDIGLAICYQIIGEEQNAVDSLERALEGSSGDRIYTTFARFRKILSPLFENPRIQRKYSEAIEDIMKLRAFTIRDQDALIHSLNRYEPSERLTKREREIAEFAAEGLRNKEIGAKLNISERTVKAHINNIFQKYNIDRRAKLLDLLQDR